MPTRTRAPPRGPLARRLPKPCDGAAIPAQFGFRRPQIGAGPISHRAGEGAGGAACWGSRCAATGTTSSRGGGGQRAVHGGAARARRAGSGEQPPQDLVYVHNFKDPDHPAGSPSPPGRAESHQGDARAGRELRRACRGSTTPMRIASSGPRSTEDARPDRRGASEGVRERVQEPGFALVQVQIGPLVRPEITPVVATSRWASISSRRWSRRGSSSPEELDRIEARPSSLTGSMEVLGKLFREIELELSAAARPISIARWRAPLVEGRRSACAATTLRASPTASPGDPTPLGSTRGAGHPRGPRRVQRSTGAGRRPGPSATRPEPIRSVRMRNYQVNVLVDNSGTRRALR